MKGDYLDPDPDRCGNPEFAACCLDVVIGLLCILVILWIVANP